MNNDSEKELTEQIKGKNAEKKQTINSPYDSVYRTLITDAPELVIPVINEIYHTELPLDTKVELLQNERFFTSNADSVERRITDCYLKVWDHGCERYFHLEMQSTQDGSMILRIFEYGSMIARGLSRIEGNRLIVRYPESSLLALRSTRNTPDEMEIELFSGNSSHLILKVPVLKIKDYTIGEIFYKKLYLLIPFHIFRYENKLADYENNQYKLKKVKTYYATIRKRLVGLAKEEKITELQESLIRRMSLAVVKSIADKYNNVKKGMEEIMGGVVLDYPEKDIYNRGIEQGKKQGIEQGKKQGIEQGKKQGIEQGMEQGMEVLIRLSMGESEEKLAEEFGEDAVNIAKNIRDRFRGQS